VTSVQLAHLPLPDKIPDGREGTMAGASRQLQLPRLFVVVSQVRT
jgi:hypothetical protein